MVVWLGKQTPGDLVHVGVNVSGGGCVLSSHISGTVLAVGKEVVDIIGPNEILRHADDGLRE